MISLTVLAVVFGAVLLLELPDKTALAGVMLGARYRPAYVFAGVAAAFVLHVALAVAAGSALALLPHRLTQGIVGVLFLVGAGALLVKRDAGAVGRPLAPADQSFWRVSCNSFSLILVAEFGDLTQIMTANLAARYEAPLAVGLGAVAALWAAAALAIFWGRALTRWLPHHMTTRVAALLMLALAAFSLYEALA